MAIDVTVGSSDANSYVDIATADTYIAERFDRNQGSDVPWKSLTDSSKEARLVVGANLLASLPFMGIRSSIRQSLAWPRLFPRDVLYAKGLFDTKGRFELYADVETAATYWEVTAPVVPEPVKQAQIEIAYQVVHRSLLAIDPLSSSINASMSEDIKSLSISGAFKVDFADTSEAEKAVASFLGGQSLTSLSFIQALLAPYLSRVRWRVA